MGRFTFWRNVGALALMGTMSYAEDQVVRDRNGDPWVISIRPGSRLAGLPLPGVTRSVPLPSEPLPPTISVASPPTGVLLPDPPPPTPGRRGVSSPVSAPAAAPLPTVATDAPEPAVPPPPAPSAPVRPAVVSPPAASPPPAVPPAPEKAPTPASPADLKLPTPALPVRALAAPVVSAPESGQPIIIPGHSNASAPRVNGRTYEEVYRSIPYSFTEYVANPSYRHEATMEILFGELRPTVIHKDSTPQAVPDPAGGATPYRPFLFAHPEQWIYRYSDYRYQWYLTPQLTAPFGVI